MRGRRRWVAGALAVLLVLAGAGVLALVLDGEDRLGRSEVETAVREAAERSSRGAEVTAVRCAEAGERRWRCSYRRGDAECTAGAVDADGHVEVAAIC